MLIHIALFTFEIANVVLISMYSNVRWLIHEMGALKVGKKLAMFSDYEHGWCHRVHSHNLVVTVDG